MIIVIGQIILALLFWAFVLYCLFWLAAMITVIIMAIKEALERRHE